MRNIIKFTIRKFGIVWPVVKTIHFFNSLSFFLITLYYTYSGLSTTFLKYIIYNLGVGPGQKYLTNSLGIKNKRLNLLYSYLPKISEILKTKMVLQFSNPYFAITLFCNFFIFLYLFLFSD